VFVYQECMSACIRNKEEEEEEKEIQKCGWQSK